MDEGLFSIEFSKSFEKLKALNTVEMSHFLKNPSFKGAYASLCDKKTDRLLLITLGKMLVERASKLIALEVAGAAVKCGKGKNSNKPICVVAEGTTFYALPGLQYCVEALLEGWLAKEKQIYTKIFHIEDAVIKGVAAIGLNRKNEGFYNQTQQIRTFFS